VAHGTYITLVRAAAFIAVALVALLAPARAGAAPKRVTGKLSKPGFTVIALAASGKASLVQVKGRSFRLRPPAARITLHLRSSNGRYAGPIVIGRKQKGRVAILGVRAGARLGRIKVGRGYARLSRALPRKWVDSKRIARAERGVPIGARRFGLVRSRNAHGPAGDPDLDGISDPLDIDDDGDRTLDNLEIARAPAARGSQAGGSPLPLGLTPTLTVPIQETTNANAGGLDKERVDSVFRRFARVAITILPGDTAELDCGGAPDPVNSAGWIGGLRYCTRGGTGGAFVVPGPPAGGWPKFPEAFDPDRDGFGTLVPVAPGSPGMGLVLGGGVADARSGDVLVERVTANGVESLHPATLQYVFGTVPALASFGDGTSSPPKVTYPVAPGAPGTLGNGFPVGDGAEDPDTDVELTVTFWRPQRLRIPGDPGEGEWMDIGRLTYTLNGFFGAGGSSCPQSAFSTTDPSLTPPPAGFPAGGGFTDPAPDRPASPGNTLTFTLNLTQCLQGKGVPFQPGDQVGLILRAYGGNGADNTEQQFSVKRK
jgi:hypothetical protein